MQIYLSYGRNDSGEYAKRLASWLRVQGYDPWLDIEHDIPPGTPFDQTTEAAIKKSAFVLALLSPESVRTDGICQYELLCAQANNIAILPVRIADVARPVQLMSHDYLDASTDPLSLFTILPGILNHIREKAYPEKAILVSTGKWWEKGHGIPLHEYLKHSGSCFIGREWLIDQLKTWAGEQDSHILLLIGEPGTGKSALAARLTAHMDVKGIHFFTPGNRFTFRKDSLIFVLIFQFASQFPAYREVLENIKPPDPSTPPELLFRMLITDPLLACRDRLDTKSPWIVVIDGLDEAAALGGTATIDFLAESLNRFPLWFRVIATTRPDSNILKRFQGNGIRQMRLDASSVDNRADLAEYIRSRTESEGSDYLPGMFSLIENLAAGNFRFAKVSLDTRAIPNYPNQVKGNNAGRSSLPFAGQYEQMFRNRFFLVTDYIKDFSPFLACLEATDRPVPEQILIAASGLDKKTATRRLAVLSQFLTRTDDGLSLFHTSLALWLTTDPERNPFAVSHNEGCRRLAEACLQEVRDSHGVLPDYVLFTLAYNLVVAKMHHGLAEILKNTRYVEGIQQANSRGFRKIWSLVEQVTPVRMRTVYAPIVEKPSRYDSSLLEIVASILHDAGHLDMAMVLYTELERVAGGRKVRGGTARFKRQRAMILREWGQLEEAMVLLKQAALILRKQEDHRELSRCLATMGSILHTKGDLDGAMKLFTEQEDLCRENEDLSGILDFMSSQALVLRSRGQVQEAEVIFTKQFLIRSGDVDPSEISRSLGIQALILVDKGELQAALTFLQKKEVICREVGDGTGLADCLANQGFVLHAKGDLEAARERYREEERICREHNNRHGLSTSLGNQGCMLFEAGNPDDAMELFRAQEEICRELMYLKGLAVSFANQALVYSQQNNDKRAVRLAHEAVTIAHEQGYLHLERKFQAILDQVQTMND